MAIQTFPYTTIEPGFSGYYDLLTTPGLRYFNENAVLTMLITGTDATIKAGGGGSDPYVISIDGSVSAPNIVSGELPLFSGLSDTIHHVSIVANLGYTPTFNEIDTTETSLVTVTGSAPSISTLETYMIGDPSLDLIFTEPTVSAPGGNVTPTHPQVKQGSNNAGRGIIIFNAQIDSLWIYTEYDGCWYSIDDATPVYVDFSPDSGERRQFLVSDSFDGSTTHTYRVWGDNKGTWGTSGITPILNNSTATLNPISTKIVIHQLGDSITEGSGSSMGAIDAWLYSIDNDYSPCVFGVSGQTTAELTIRIPDYYSESPIPDYVLLATGRNDALLDIQTDYTACLQALINEGATNIICRGILPEESELWVNENAAIEAAISSLSNPNIVFMDSQAWLGIETADGVHPTILGYQTLNSYEAPALLVIIEPPIVYEITGVTYDKSGAILPSCQVSLFKHSGSGIFVYVGTQISNGTTGAYSFTGLDNNDPGYMVYAHKTDTINAFDCSDNNLTPIEVV